MSERWVMVDRRPALLVAEDSCTDGNYFDYRFAGERQMRWLRAGNPRLRAVVPCLSCGQAIGNADCPMAAPSPGAEYLICTLCDTTGFPGRERRAVHELDKYGLRVTGGGGGAEDDLRYL